MKVSLVIPVYNEARHLTKFLDLIDSVELPLPRELVIVDDFSTDGSREILRNYKFKSEVVYFEQPRNQGKGAAVAAGISRATGNVIGVQDADFEYDVKDVPKLLQPLIEGRADVVFGSRFKKDGHQVHRTFHYAINRFLTLMSNLLSGLFLSDMETCYKFFRADIIKNISLESKRFGFEPEITAKVARLNLRVMEMPISYHPRNYAAGKKITWKDGVAALRHIVYFNLFSDRKEWFSKSMALELIPTGRQLL